MRQRIKVVRIIGRLNIGGPAVHIANLLDGLAPAEFESHLVIGSTSAFEGDMAYLLETRTENIHPIEELQREVSVWGDVTALIKIVRLLRKLQPDIVETHTAKAGAIGRVAAYLARVPCTIHVYHGMVFEGYFGPLKSEIFRRVERSLARFTSKIVAISGAQRNDLVQKFKITDAGKVEVIPLGIDLSQYEKPYRPISKNESPPPVNRPLVGFVGRLTAIKRPEIFISAAKIVSEQRGDAHFALVGDGEMREHLERQCQMMNMTDRITFSGWQKEMPAVYKTLDCLALCSDNEGTPLSIIEALASETPVVATDVGGVAEVLDHGAAGTLVAPDSAESLADGILDVLENGPASAARVQRGKIHVTKTYGRAAMIESTTKLYRRQVDSK
ncbi:glycosyltransferase [Candidatus Binatia bacterium]|nr:glycosyltransferase [Candidatus Binatia bacterium]